MPHNGHFRVLGLWWLVWFALDSTPVAAVTGSEAYRSPRVDSDCISLSSLGKYWCLRHVTCDNDAVVAVMRLCSCKDPALMHLLRCMFFFEARFSCKLSAVHISGEHNDRADDLSRNHLSSFFRRFKGRTVYPLQSRPHS